MWKAAGLQEPCSGISNKASTSTGNSDDEEGEADNLNDNLHAAGFCARWGRDANRGRGGLGTHAGTHMG
eukprot:5333013-Prymnesium_polylepis.1